MARVISVGLAVATLAAVLATFAGSDTPLWLSIRMLSAPVMVAALGPFFLAAFTGPREGRKQAGLLAATGKWTRRVEALAIVPICVGAGIRLHHWQGAVVGGVLALVFAAQYDASMERIRGYALRDPASPAPPAVRATRAQTLSTVARLLVQVVVQTIFAGGFVWAFVGRTPGIAAAAAWLLFVAAVAIQTLWRHRRRRAGV